MFDRLRGVLTRTKATAATAVALIQQNVFDWKNALWPRIDFRRLTNEGYTKHGIVFACVQRWATTLPGAKMHLYREDEETPIPAKAHRIAKLLKRPNPVMTQRLFIKYLVTYALVGGVAYAWKERDLAGRVIALWPLHRGQLSPVPLKGNSAWLSHYSFDPGDGSPPLVIPKEDIISWIWAIDPLAPIDGLAPIVAAARAIDTGTEAMRYVYALLSNDAVARTVIVVKTLLPDTIQEKMLKQYQAQYGGDYRGKTALVHGEGAEIKRVGANLQELAAQALHDVPDAWICSAFDVPSVLVGSASGLQRAIQGAPSEMQTYWTETSIIPRWDELDDVFTLGLILDEIQRLADLGQGLGDLAAAEDWEVRFDLTAVRALQEDMNALRTNAVQVFASGLATWKEARAVARLPEVDGPDFRLQKAGVTEIDPSAPRVEPTAPAPALPAPDDGGDEGDGDFIDLDALLDDAGRAKANGNGHRGNHTNGHTNGNGRAKAVNPDTGKFEPDAPKLAGKAPDPTPTDKSVDADAVRFAEWARVNIPEFAGLFEDQS